MPYGLRALIASISLTGVYVLVSETPAWSKVPVAALFGLSLVWHYGVFLQVALSISLSLYFTYFKSRV